PADGRALSDAGGEAVGRAEADVRGQSFFDDHIAEGDGSGLDRDALPGLQAPRAEQPGGEDERAPYRFHRRRVERTLRPAQPERRPLAERVPVERVEHEPRRVA